VDVLCFLYKIKREENKGNRNEEKDTKVTTSYHIHALLVTLLLKLGYFIFKRSIYLR